MTDRHCRIGRVAVSRPLYIPGYTFLERVDLVEDYDDPAPQTPTWFVYRHSNADVGRYA